MFRQSVENLKDNILINGGLGADLYLKNEFAELVPYINNKEKLYSAIVCQIEGDIYLLCFTQYRLLLVRKERFLGTKVQRIGLENIKNIELIDDQGYGQLLFSFYDNKSMRIESITTLKAQKFGKQLVENIKNFNLKSEGAK